MLTLFLTLWPRNFQSCLLFECHIRLSSATKPVNSSLPASARSSALDSHYDYFTPLFPKAPRLHAITRTKMTRCISYARMQQLPYPDDKLDGIGRSATVER
jgi:hypothetical protein